MVGGGTFIIFNLRAYLRAVLPDEGVLPADTRFAVFLVGAFLAFFAATSFAFLAGRLVRLAAAIFACFRFVLLTIVIIPLVGQRRYPNLG